VLAETRQPGFYFAMPKLVDSSRPPSLYGTWRDEALMLRRQLAAAHSMAATQAQTVRYLLDTAHTFVDAAEAFLDIGLGEPEYMI
jgi:hypothetical protein